MDDKGQSTACLRSSYVYIHPFLSPGCIVPSTEASMGQAKPASPAEPRFNLNSRQTPRFDKYSTVDGHALGSSTKSYEPWMTPLVPRTAEPCNILTNTKSPYLPHCVNHMHVTPIALSTSCVPYFATTVKPSLAIALLPVQTARRWNLNHGRRAGSNCLNAFKRKFCVPSSNQKCRHEHVKTIATLDSTS